MVGFFLIQVIGGMVGREPAALTRAAFGLATSILGSSCSHDEPWGIRRFFVRSPDGHVINVARHRS